jgi:hypothetical protein
MGMNGGPVYARACAEALPPLFALISSSDSRSVENNTATENAVSAVTKIFKYNNSCVDNIDKVKYLIEINKNEIIQYYLASSSLVILASYL